jgi:hypothetical protein
MLPLLLAAATSAAQAFTTGPSSAIPTGQTPSPNDLEAPHRLRSGLVFGAAFGGSLVGASGYPNDAVKINDPSYYSASGWMLGTSESLFLMGALTDYLNFGFWYKHATASNRDWRSNGDGGGLRVEVFPLVAILPRFAGLGLLGQFGVGAGRLTTAKTPSLTASEGTQSFGGAGAFYEWSFGHFLGGHFGVGPTLEYDAIWSQSFERHGLIASARLVFCGGP